MFLLSSFDNNRTIRTSRPSALQLGPQASRENLENDIFEEFFEEDEKLFAQQLLLENSWDQRGFSLS